MQNACYCCFSTELNKIFHIKYVKICPQQKIIVEFIKISPFKRLHPLDLLILCCYLNDPQLCFFV